MFWPAIVLACTVAGTAHAGIDAPSAETPATDCLLHDVAMQGMDMLATMYRDAGTPNTDIEGLLTQGAALKKACIELGFWPAFAPLDTKEKAIAFGRLAATISSERAAAAKAQIERLLALVEAEDPALAARLRVKYFGDTPSP